MVLKRKLRKQQYSLTIALPKQLMELYNYKEKDTLEVQVVSETEIRLLKKI